MAAPTGAERKILKILSHAPAVASLSFGSRTLVPQPLMTHIMCRLWGRGCFYEASGRESTAAWTGSIVLGLLINVKGCWGTIPAVLSGANRGKQGALKLSRGPISRSICCLAAIPTTGPIVSGVGYVSVYLHVLVVPVLTAGMERIVFLCLPRDWKSLSLCT